MNILVTGSNGYIGSVAVPVIQQAGHTVTGYDTGWFGRATDARWLVIGDIRNNIVHSGWPDVVVHLAGLSNDPMGDLSPALTREINYWGTIDFASRFPRARHVVVSSCAVYGQADHLCDETSDPNPQTTYAECKARTDKWMAQSPLDHVILRLGTVFGHSPNHRLDLVVNRMVYDSLVNRQVQANGNPARPLTHVNDVASAILWAIEGSATGIYNVVGENMRMIGLARSVASFAACPVLVNDGGADTRDYMASGEKLLRAGWAPTYSVEGSLPVLFEKSLDYDAGNFDDRIRLSALRRLIESGELDPETLRYAA